MADDLWERLSKCEGFDWDAGNAPKIWEKHEVAPGEAEQVFFNRPLVAVPDVTHSEMEPRFLALGQTDAGRRLFEVMAILPIISPPFVGALSIILLLGQNGVITRGLLGVRDFPIYGLPGLLLAQVLTFFPVAYLTLRGVLESISPTLEDAAMDLGAGRWTVFRRVTLPLSAPGASGGEQPSAAARTISAASTPRASCRPGTRLMELGGAAGAARRGRSASSPGSGSAPAAPALASRARRDPPSPRRIGPPWPGRRAAGLARDAKRAGRGRPGPA